MSQVIALGIVILLVVGLISYIVKIYNLFVMIGFNVDKAFANIDVILKQRADEIPNLVIVVKKTAEYEEDILKDLTRLRTAYMQAALAEDKIQINNEISKELKHVLLMVSESYPDIKANQSFLKLQGRISELEDHIADRREFFNDSVNIHNISINEFPNLIVAKMMSLTNKTLLQVTEQEKAYSGVKI